MARKQAAANLILDNANIVTCAAGRSSPAQAIAVRGERIIHVGPNSEMAGFKNDACQVVDCCGKTLLPGFNDAHCHFFALAKRLLSIDLSPARARSIRDMQRLVRKRAADLPPGTWIRGSGYNEFYLAEKRHPNRHDLDQAAPSHPVVITHRSLHACVLNTAAMELAGISNETPEPPGGIIERDLDTGEPNGVLFEMEDFIRQRIPPAISAHEMDRAAQDASAHLMSLGITSFGDATATNSLSDWETYRELKLGKLIASRVYMMFGIKAFDTVRKAKLAALAGDNEVRLGGLKVIISQATGRLFPSQAELNEIVTMADAAGFQVALHAVEGTAIEAAIVALENALSNRTISGPTNPRRHRIEHCSECPPELIGRLKRAGVVVVSQPPFIYFNGERYLAEVSPPVQKMLYPLRSLQKAGLTVAASSDAPVVPANPLDGIYAAVTRLTESNQVLLSREGVSPAAALNMYTINGAYASFAEHEKGMLVPGMLADMVMLSENPLTCPPARMREIRVEMTIVGGKVMGIYQDGKSML